MSFQRVGRVWVRASSMEMSQQKLTNLSTCILVCSMNRLILLKAHRVVWLLLPLNSFSGWSCLMNKAIWHWGNSTSLWQLTILLWRTASSPQMWVHLCVGVQKRKKASKSRKWSPACLCARVSCLSSACLFVCAVAIGPLAKSQVDWQPPASVQGDISDDLFHLSSGKQRKMVHVASQVVRLVHYIFVLF